MKPVDESAREPVEQITWNEKPLALIIRSEFNPQKTSFLTPLDYNLQLGFVVYPASGEVLRHVHRPLERHIVGTTEVLLVKTGRCEMDIFNDDRELVCTRELRAGDVMLMVGGGHGFRMIEDTILIEIKQGPYTGIDEKERF
jgi:hypothetical protein